MANNSTAPRLTVRAVAGNEELRLADTLMASACVDGLAGVGPRYDARGAEYPVFHKDHTRIALWNKELAGALRLHTQTIRLGEARLRMGGLGLMTTAPSFKRRGVSAALMRDALDYLVKQRYHVSVIFGLPEFFQRFGFAPVLAGYSILIDALELSLSARVMLKHRPLKPGDLDAVQKIHSANGSRLPCSVVRSAVHFANNWERVKTARVCTNHQGKVVGYYFLRSTGDCLEVEEVGAERAEVIRDILGACVELSHAEGSGLVRFQVPPDHPFAHYLAQYESRHEMHIGAQEGGMMAFVDLDEALESMIPEWESQLSQSLLRDVRCELTLVVAGGPYRIRANRGAIDIARSAGQNKFTLDKAELIQLVTGASYVDDVVDRYRRFMAPGIREFLGVLFPKRNPYLPILDRF